MSDGAIAKATNKTFNSALGFLNPKQHPVVAGLFYLACIGAAENQTGKPILGDALNTSLKGVDVVTHWTCNNTHPVVKKTCNGDFEFLIP